MDTRPFLLSREEPGDEARVLLAFASSGFSSYWLLILNVAGGYLISLICYEYATNFIIAEFPANLTT